MFKSIYSMRRDYSIYELVWLVVECDDVKMFEQKNLYFISASQASGLPDFRTSYSWLLTSLNKWSMHKLILHFKTVFRTSRLSDFWTLFTLYFRLPTPEKTRLRTLPESLFQAGNGILFRMSTRFVYFVSSLTFWVN